MNVVCCCAGCR